MDFLVSVLIPVYNVERYIEQCLDSVIAQTYGNIEIIVVDDGSTDRSGEILDAYAGRDGRVRVIHKPNGGVSAARNDGLKLCAGEYVYIMDSDDFIEPDAIERMCREAVDADADVVITDHCIFRDDKTEESKPKHFFSKAFRTDDPALVAQIRNMVLYSTYSPYPTEENKGLGIAAPWTKLVRTRLVRENGLAFDPYLQGVFDDGMFALDVMQHAKRVAYIRYIAYHYRLLGSSLMRGYRANRIEINERIFQRIREFGVKYGLGDDYDRAAYARVILFLRYAFEAYLFNEKHQVSVWKRWREYRALLSMPSYREAARKADIGSLRPREQRLARLVNSRLRAAGHFIKQVRSGGNDGTPTAP